MERTADTELLAGEASVATESNRPLYPPSWVDRLTDRVRQLPVPPWSFYLLLGLVLALADAVVNWNNGSYPASTSLPYHLLSDLTPGIIMAMIHYFDDWAGKALATFRPALAVGEADYKDLQYQLTTLPRLQTIGVSLLGVAYGCIYLLFLYNSQIDPFRIFTSSVASVFDFALALVIYMSYFLIIYHTLHQMRMISRIYGKCRHIDLFQLGPLYAFSTVAARVSIGIAIMTYAWIYALSVSGDIASVLTPLFAIPLLSATFILPLVGIHGLLQEEKTRLQSENALHVKAAIKELHHRSEAGEYGEMDGVGKAIDSLVKEQTLLKDIPTWPWHPETARWVATAILAPVFLALVTGLAQRLMGL